MSGHKDGDLFENRCPYDENSEYYIDPRYVDAQYESYNKMDLSLYQIQQENGVMEIKQKFVYYDDSVQQKLKDRPVSFYTREALPYLSSCLSDKKTIISVIEANREMIAGSQDNPGGASSWVLGAKRFTVFLVLFQGPLLLFSYEFEEKYHYSYVIGLTINIVLTVITIK